MRITYLIMSTFSELIFILGMLFTPIYVTPGWYFCPALLAILFITNGIALSARVNEWNKMDLLK